MDRISHKYLRPPNQIVRNSEFLSGFPFFGGGENPLLAIVVIRWLSRHTLPWPIPPAINGPRAIKSDGPPRATGGVSPPRVAGRHVGLFITGQAKEGGTYKRARTTTACGMDATATATSSASWRRPVGDVTNPRPRRNGTPPNNVLLVSYSTNPQCCVVTGTSPTRLLDPSSLRKKKRKRKRQIRSILLFYGVCSPFGPPLKPMISSYSYVHEICMDQFISLELNIKVAKNTYVKI